MSRTSSLFVAACMALTSLCGTRHAAAAPQSPKPTVQDVIDAIREVETGGNPNPTNAVGDGGRSIGPWQISRPYYDDALWILNQQLEATPSYSVAAKSDVWGPKIMLAYWTRYCPEAVTNVDAQTLARTHSGGLFGPSRSATLPYWHKVQAVLLKKGFAV